MASSPSAAFLRLRAYIAERMRMSPIDQPLMLMELLSHRCPAPAQDVARWILEAHGGWRGGVCPTATACVRLLGAGRAVARQPPHQRA